MTTVTRSQRAITKIVSDAKKMFSWYSDNFFYLTTRNFYLEKEFYLVRNNSCVKKKKFSLQEKKLSLQQENILLGIRKNHLLECFHKKIAKAAINFWLVVARVVHGTKKLHGKKGFLIPTKSSVKIGIKKMLQQQNVWFYQQNVWLLRQSFWLQQQNFYLLSLMLLPSPNHFFPCSNGKFLFGRIAKRWWLGNAWNQAFHCGTNNGRVKFALHELAR